MTRHLDVVVVAVYVAALLILLRPGSIGQSLITESGLAMATVL